MKEIQQQREAERRQEALENDIDARQFHAMHGSDEEIYQEARKAAAGYLAEMGVEQDEEEEEEEGSEESEEPDEGKEMNEEEMTDEEVWADTPGKLLKRHSTLIPKGDHGQQAGMVIWATVNGQS